MKLSADGLDRLLLKVGFGVYAAFTVLSLFSVWGNAGGGMIFSWLTLKYFGLLALGALPLILPSGHRAYMFVFAGLLAVLTFSDTLTYSRDQIRDLGNLAERALEQKGERLNSEYELTEEEAEVKRIEGILGALDRDSRLKEHDKDAYENMKKKMEEELKDAKEVLERAKKSVRVSDMVALVELSFEAKRMEKEKVSDQNCRDLAGAKHFDFFILAGAFLMVVSALLAAPATPASRA
ncbi:MAG: hypothetical protein MUE73_13620 [Planctomycetes bacterium]|jgi:hypothetical protein|nr:hypothetical protein [Planctomycetota bacterium]